MTEIEKIEYAKSFIDKLADGINPLDDTPVRADDVVNNVRISRCFFYVSDILRQVIENGGVSRRKSGTLNFQLTAEELSGFMYSRFPIPISEIAKRLNLLITNEEMRKISHRDLTNWLMSVGLIYEQARPDGKKQKLPTEEGQALGISVDKREGAHGVYYVTVYSREAQSFIIDNLDAVVAMKYDK